MQKVQRFRFVAIIGLVVALTTAGLAFAGDNIFDTAEDPQPTVCPPTGGTVDEGDTTHDSTDVGATDEDNGTVDEGDQDESADDVEGDTPEEGDQDESADDEDESTDCEDAAEDTDDAEEADDPAGDAAEAGDEGAQAEEFTAEDCLAAAGLKAGDEPTEAPVPGELHGLENSSAHLLWNCLDHPNHGLVNALTNHTAKLDAWLEKQQSKAERKAEHEAAKAARELSHSS